MSGGETPTAYAHAPMNPLGPGRAPFPDTGGRMLNLPRDAQLVPCAEPANRALVDAAFEKPGGIPGDRMREKLCRHCPFAAECLDHAMHQHEQGVWGGTSPNLRTRHGAPPSEGYGYKRKRSAA